MQSTGGNARAQTEITKDGDFSGGRAQGQLIRARPNARPSDALRGAR
jgi:hypothetical protein